MGKGDRFWKMEARKTALRKAEASGAVADSMEVRKAIMARFHSGEWTLEQCKAELARVKREGKTTRADFYR